MITGAGYDPGLHFIQATVWTWSQRAKDMQPPDCGASARRPFFPSTAHLSCLVVDHDWLSTLMLSRIRGQAVVLTHGSSFSKQATFALTQESTQWLYKYCWRAACRGCHDHRVAEPWLASRGSTERIVNHDVEWRKLTSSRMFQKFQS